MYIFNFSNQGEFTLRDTIKNIGIVSAVSVNGIRLAVGIEDGSVAIYSDGNI